MEKLFLTIEDLQVGLKSFAGRRLNVIVNSSKCFEVEMSHIFGEDLMASSIFCHFQQTTPWTSLPHYGSPLSALLQCFRVVFVFPTEW